MHILFLTWKDLGHPRAWGAEVVLHNYMKRLVLGGHSVTWFASWFEGGSPESTLDGIRVIRRYNIRSIYFLAWRWFREFSRQETIDCIVDEAGGIPLLSPLYVRRIPIVFFIHHIGDREWDAEFPFPFGTIAKRIFLLFLGLYRSFPTITVSESTRQELLTLGFDATKTRVIENALDFSPIEKVDMMKKENALVFVGRLAPIKRAEDAIRAFHIFSQVYPEYMLKIIGREYDMAYFRMLRQEVAALGLSGRVEFFGSLPFDERNRVLESSKLCLVPSEKEWFGLVVLESNAFGTPVAAYNVAGLRDTVIEGVNGSLVASGDFSALAEKMIEMLRDEDDYRELAESSLRHVKSLPDWDRQTQVFERIMKESIGASRK